MSPTFIVSRILMLVYLSALVSCGYLPSQAERDRAELNWPEEKLYLTGKGRLDAGSCTGAIDYYLKLQQRFPFGSYTRQSFVEIAYCYYKTNDPDLAMETLDEFIELYPSHPNMPYAFYLRGLLTFIEEGELPIDFYLEIKPKEIQVTLDFLMILVLWCSVFLKAIISKMLG